MVTYFDQYQKATNSSPWTLRGNSYLGLSRFYSDAAAGTLPEVSYIVGPAELSERYPYLPIDGAWLQRKVVESIIDGAAYNETVLIISYDGKQPTPESTWLSIKLNRIQRSEAMGEGYVFTEHADRNSQIIFVEKWPTAIGKGVQSREVNIWRHQHISDLTKAFDFDHVSVAGILDESEFASF
jgi:phospholipase C